MFFCFCLFLFFFFIYLFIFVSSFVCHRKRTRNQFFAQMPCNVKRFNVTITAYNRTLYRHLHLWRITLIIHLNTSTFRPLDVGGNSVSHDVCLIKSPVTRISFHLALYTWSTPTAWLHPSCILDLRHFGPHLNSALKRFGLRGFPLRVNLNVTSRQPANQPHLKA